MLRVICMVESTEPIILCIASFFKGNKFIRECWRQDLPTVLLTREKLLTEAWERDCLEGLFAVPGEGNAQSYLMAATQIARHRRISRVVALEEYDVVTAAYIREHLCLPGIGSTAAKHFQDKLAMRVQAQNLGIPQPPFVSLVNCQSVGRFMEEIQPPWMLKPRVGASSMGIRKLHTPEEVWRAISELDQRENFHEQSPFYLLEKHVPGDVYHVDSLVDEGEILFANVERYGAPPFDIAHFGGVTTSHSIPHDSAERNSLIMLNEKLLRSLRFEPGVTHAEFIHCAGSRQQEISAGPQASQDRAAVQNKDDAGFYFLEVAARVGGAYTAETVEAATGIDLWREWARIELASPARPYSLPKVCNQHSGIAVALARQEHPDTSRYTDPEIVYRVQKPWHVGLIVRSADYSRIRHLLSDYVRRFNEDFTAFCPAEETPEYYLRHQSA